MSTSEIESKVRELRQLQALIEEAQAEAESIKDAIKAAMGDSEELRAGEYPYHLEAGTGRQTGRCGPEKGPPRRGGALHQDYHHTAILRSVRKAPIP